MSLGAFHPAVRDWFESQFEAPTEPQRQAWPSIGARRHTLIAAPTGSGKTLAAFLSAIDTLVQQAEHGPLPDETQVVYVSPLKALSNDIHRNLQVPLEGIGRELARRGVADAGIRVQVRTGDTPSAARQAMLRRPPHLVVTTPESLYILLTSERGRNMLQTTHTVIVDEIHALVGDKRGSHLALTLERLEALAGRPLVRIGLSATQRPIEAVARFLVGGRAAPDGEPPDCTIIDSGHVRQLDLAIEVPGSPLEAVMAGEVWDEIYDRLAALVSQHRTTLVFVNTRRLAERVTRYLSERIGVENVTSHHGSLSREHRLRAEQRLKRGDLRALVATASLELGIDIGDVDLVCQIGSTRSIATFLQRVGRSGHGVGRLPKGHLFPLTRDELVECAALLDAVRRGELDRLTIPEQPLDILAQQIVAAVACEEWREDALYELVRNAHPYRNLSRQDFDAVVGMLAEGFSTRRGRRGAHLHHDAVNHRLRARRGARLAAITSGGAIPDTADYQVVLEPHGTFVGTVNEDFAVESIPGDIFQLGNTSWRIRRVEPGRVRVEDAQGQPPTIPFWLGEAPGRSRELSHAVSRLRAEVARRVAQDGPGVADDGATPESVSDPGTLSLQTCRWLVEEVGTPPAGARQIVDYLAAGQAALGVMPSQDVVVFERFFDETGGMQLVVHAPFGSRVNRAWGLALRKRFCRRFNVELQAAATEDAIVLSLGPTHSFPLADVARYLDAATVRGVLEQALLAAPMFTLRWRWNATRSLAVLRFRGGKRVAPQLTRIMSEDLLAVVFPDQVACAENLPGDREIPDHPLVRQTIHDCLEEAMDVAALQDILRRIASGDIAVVARDLREPSPLSQEILNARPYAFLDDAPLEERRTQAVLSRRWLDPETAADIGALDASAVERLREEIWPQPEHADELHDALVLFGFLTEAEGRAADGWDALYAQLVGDRRATRLRAHPTAAPLWVAAERLQQVLTVFPDATLEPHIEPPTRSQTPAGPEEALVELLRGRLEGLGPVRAATLARSLSLDPTRVEVALARLETEGFVLRGRFTPGVDGEEWCERRLLARIHRYTLKRLRSEIEPVSATDLMRFLLEWQHVVPESNMEGSEGVAAVVEQLEGFEAPAIAWEAEILAARVPDYDPQWLDALCLAGRCTWARRSRPRAPAIAAPEAQRDEPLLHRSEGTRRGRAGPVRTSPIAFLHRSRVHAWDPNGDASEPHLSAGARAVRAALAQHGASFFDDIVRTSGLLRTQIEAALGELVAAGCVSADSFVGLRALLVPSDRRRPLHSGVRRRRNVAHFGVEDAGRWVLLQGPPDDRRSGTHERDEDDAVEAIARVLLRRYGILFRKLVERETLLPPWRELLRVLRRMEARGEIRGGRFAAGFTGEQYALPEAVGRLRSVRRSAPDGILIAVSAADPLNLVGLVTPGSRIPAHPDNRILYRDGVAVATRVAREIRILCDDESVDVWEVRQALARRPIPLPLRRAMRPA